jgi:hypothetical protein
LPPSTSGVALLRGRFAAATATNVLVSAIGAAVAGVGAGGGGRWVVVVVHGSDPAVQCVLVASANAPKW